MTGPSIPKRWAWLVAAAPLLPVLGVGFLLDDFVGLDAFERKGWAILSEELLPGSGGLFLRPLGLLFFGLERSLYGLEAWAWHATHLSLFAFAAWQTGRLAGRLQGAEFSASAAALALLYPGRVETYCWIAAVFDLLTLNLVLAAVLADVAFRERGGTARLGLVGALAFLSPFAKEVGYCLPIVLLGAEVVGGLPPAPLGRRVAGVLSAIAGAGCAAGYRLLALEGFGGYQGTRFALSWSDLARFTRAACETVFVPVDFELGLLSLAAGVLCAVAIIARGLLGLRGARSGTSGSMLLRLGSLIAVAGLLPALPYLPVAIATHHSRYVSIAGAGVALIGASAVSVPGRGSRAAVGLLLSAWSLATLLNLQPWLGAASRREVILDAVERTTRAPGRHSVWIDGPIDDYRGAHVLGGALQAAIRVTLPERRIEADSSFLQRYEGRVVGPPTPKEGVTPHVLRYQADGPSVEEIDRPAMPRY